MWVWKELNIVKEILLLSPPGQECPGGFYMKAYFYASRIECAEILVSLPFGKPFFQQGNGLIHHRCQDGKDDDTHHDPIQFEYLHTPAEKREKRGTMDSHSLSGGRGRFPLGDKCRDCSHKAWETMV